MPFSCAIAGTLTPHQERHLARRVARRPADDHAGVVGLAAPMTRRTGRLVTAERFVTARPLPVAPASVSTPTAGSFVTVPAISTVTAP